MMADARHGPAGKEKHDTRGAEQAEVIAGLERRIKRSDKAGAALSESPLWLLIPVYPAKYEVASQSYQRSVQGEAEYMKPDQDGVTKDALLANAAADQTYLPMLGKNKPPLMQRIFNFTYKGSKDADANFLVTKDIKRRAIARELKKYVSGGSAEADTPGPSSSTLTLPSLKMMTAMLRHAPAIASSIELSRTS